MPFSGLDYFALDELLTDDERLVRDTFRRFVDDELMPIVGGKLAVAMEATRLDEEEFEFVGEDLAHAHVSSVEEALALIRDNVGALRVAA